MMRCLLVVSALLASACYNPRFISGQTECGPGGACPEGFSCRADNRCWLREPGGDLASPPGGDLAMTEDMSTGGGDMAMLISPFLRVRGGVIVDGAGREVRLTGLSWFGFETDAYAPLGLWVRKLGDVLDQMRSLGYNTLRLPFSNQLLQASSMSRGLDANPELMGLSGLQLLDRVINEAGRRGLRVILARSRATAAPTQSGLWYTNDFPDSRWIADWTALAMRYRNNPAVVGFDLHMEPHDPATWGSGNPMTDWRLAAERAGQAILGAHPDVLIIVEGVQSFGADSYWWGGNLQGVQQHPVRLPAERLVYATSDYPQSVNPQPWFGAGFPDNLPGVWDKFWGYLVKDPAPSKRVPVLLAGFGVQSLAGTGQTVMKDRQWWSKLAEYITQNKLSFAYWCLNPDPFYGGILKTDWNGVQGDKHDALKPLLAPLFPPL